jgi:hypothetical protein
VCLWPSSLFQCFFRFKVIATKTKTETKASRIIQFGRSTHYADTTWKDEPIERRSKPNQRQCRYSSALWFIFFNNDNNLIRLILEKNWKQDFQMKKRTTLIETNVRIQISETSFIFTDEPLFFCSTRISKSNYVAKD